MIEEERFIEVLEKLKDVEEDRDALQRVLGVYVRLLSQCEDMLEDCRKKMNG